ncbi:MAG: hypothetical protein ACRC9X_03460 [Bacteroidales bacterium]
MKHFFSILSVAICLCTYAQTSTSYVLKLAPILQRVINPNGFGLQPAYLDSIANASPYLGDFHGVQILQNVPLQEMEAELLPISKSDTTLTLQVPSGTAKLYYGGQLSVMNHNFPYQHIVFEGTDYLTFLKVKQEFYALLKTKKLLRKYLPTNPFYKDEQEVQQYLDLKNKLPLPAYKSDDFAEEQHAVLIYPDRVHGDSAAFEGFLQFLDSLQFDWLALEMLPQSMQSIAHNYIFSIDGSPSFTYAKEQLIAYYTKAWTSHFKQPFASVDQMPFMRLFAKMRQRKTPIYGLEKASSEFIFFRNGETPFGAAVRNLHWADATPTKGKGVVFGGIAHFTDSRPINYQNLLCQRQPLRRPFIVK